MYSKDSRKKDSLMCVRCESPPPFKSRHPRRLSANGFVRFCTVWIYTFLYGFLALAHFPKIGIMPRASRLTCYARERCGCLTCSMSAAQTACVVLAAPLLLVLGLLVGPLVVLDWLRARACVRRFFRTLRGAEEQGGSVVICARRYVVVDVRPSRRDEPASVLLLHLVSQPSQPSEASSYHDDGMIPSLVHAASFDLAFATGRVQPFLVHLSEETLEYAAFAEQIGRPGRWTAWMDCAVRVPARPGDGGLIAALASPHPLPLFSNARTTDVRPSFFRSKARCLHCEDDAGLFLVGCAPWLSALLLPYDLAARRVQRAWRAAVGDPSRRLCRRRLLREAQQMDAELSRGRAP